MNNIDNFYEHYERLIEIVGQDKIESRYNFLFECMSNLIERMQAKDKVYINERVLMHSVLEYFEDIYKMKDAHAIVHVNSTKVMAYSAYWILRRHPIQLMKPIHASEADERLVFINEKFVLTALMQFLTSEHEAMPLVDKKLKAYQGFLNTFFYYLKFRKLDAQSIEMILLAFQAGQIISVEIE